MIIKGAFTQLIYDEVVKGYKYEYHVRELFMNVDLGKLILGLNIYPSPWCRFLLRFVPTKRVTDSGVTMVFKFWKGIVYVINIEGEDYADK
ncbi:hypothetical protein LCGC14_3144460, partial [marine sediment metagenome]